MTIYMNNMFSQWINECTYREYRFVQMGKTRSIFG